MTPKIPHINEDGEEKKRCGKCTVYQTIKSFGYSKSTWDKLRPTCKQCLHDTNIKNKEKRREYNKRYWKKTMDIQKEKNKKWRIENKQHVKNYMKKWTDVNKDYLREMSKKYREANLEKKREYNRNWVRKNYKDMKTSSNREREFTEYKIKYNTSRRIRELLGNSKTDITIHYLGCTVEKFRNHLEIHFKDGMNWNNYGVSINLYAKYAWHIDHNIPCKAFELSNPIHQMACFHYKNLKPLWWYENIRKGGQYEKEKRDVYLQRFIETYIIP